MTEALKNFAKAEHNLAILARNAMEGSVSSLLILADLADSVHVREEGIAAIDSGDPHGLQCAVESALEAIHSQPQQQVRVVESEDDYHNYLCCCSLCPVETMCDEANGSNVCPYGRS